MPQNQYTLITWFSGLMLLASYEEVAWCYCISSSNKTRREFFVTVDHHSTFPIQVFEGLSFLYLDITLPFAKLCYAFQEKLFFLPS